MLNIHSKKNNIKYEELKKSKLVLFLEHITSSVASVRIQLLSVRSQNLTLFTVVSMYPGTQFTKLLLSLCLRALHEPVIKEDCA